MPKFFHVPLELIFDSTPQVRLPLIDSGCEQRKGLHTSLISKLRKQHSQPAVYFVGGGRGNGRECIAGLVGGPIKRADPSLSA